MAKRFFHTAVTAQTLFSVGIPSIDAGLQISRFKTTEAKTVAFTAAEDADVYLCSASGGAYTGLLPASPVAGDTYCFVKTDASANAVTVGGNGKNINGASTKVLPAQYDKTTVVYDGTEWFIIS